MNKIGKVYSLAYPDVPKLFFKHLVCRCCTVIQDHCFATMCSNSILGHSCSNVATGMVAKAGIRWLVRPGPYEASILGKSLGGKAPGVK
jgi:hypothetical protein